MKWKMIVLLLVLTAIFSSSTALSVPDQHANWKSEDDYYTFVFIRLFAGDVLIRKGESGNWYITKHVRQAETCLGNQTQLKERINEYRKGNSGKSQAVRRVIRNTRGFDQGQLQASRGGTETQLHSIAQADGRGGAD